MLYTLIVALVLLDFVFLKNLSDGVGTVLHRYLNKL